MTFHALTHTPVSFLAYRAAPIEEADKPFLRTNIGVGVADLSAEQALELADYIYDKFGPDAQAEEKPAEEPEDMSNWAVAPDEDV